MKIYLGALIALFVVCVFTSCQKEVNEILPNHITNADSTNLDRLIALDTTQPVGMDSLEKDIFQYDNNKRLVKQATYFFPVYLPDTLLSEFFYLGNEILPYKEVHHDTYLSSNGETHFVDTVYYAFTNGIVSKDSIITWDLLTNHNFGVDVSQYTAQGNIVTVYFRHYDAVAGNYALTQSDTSTFAVAYAGGNLVSQTRTSGNRHDIRNSAQVVYDDKINPLALANKIKYPLFGVFSGIDWYSQNNNPVTIHYQESTSDPFEDIDLNYIYSSNSYPKTATAKDRQTGEYEKLIYLYK